MAPRNMNRETANEVLQDSLGISGDDLGMDRENALEGLNFDDDGESLPDDDDDDLDPDNLPGNNREIEEPELRTPIKKEAKEKPDDLSVTHTPKDEFDHGKPKFDKKGNILGSKGQIIAYAGREARMYQQLHGVGQQVNDITQRANTAIQAERGKVQQAVRYRYAVEQSIDCYA